MQVIRIDVGHEPRVTEMENTLKAFQEAVGGYIETVTLERTGLVVRADPDGEDFTGVRACDLGLIQACWVPCKAPGRA